MREQPQLEVEEMETAALVPYARNSKRHTRRQVDQIAQSIGDYGFNDPVGVWETPSGEIEIVEGHGRVMAAKKLGLATVPVIRLDHLSDEQRRAYTHIHNQTGAVTDIDLATVAEDLGDIDVGLLADYDFGAAYGEASEDEAARPDFGELGKFDQGKQDGNDDYNDFVEKFEAKRTTDDCYTPEIVYDAVADWVASEYGLDRSTFVRPFYPGGDYQKEEYRDGAVVVDNPPFSISSEICRWYADKGIPFFLFANALTLFSPHNSDGYSFVPVGVGVTYANGAKVSTSFITNLEPAKIRTAPDLYEAVFDADKKNRGNNAVELPSYTYPDCIVTGAKCAGLAKNGVEVRVYPNQCERIGQLDAQKESGKALFGGGYILSESATRAIVEATIEADENKARKAAERYAATGSTVERDSTIVWELSEREREIVRGLA